MLFLDADVAAVADPTALFDSPDFALAGALLWQDYWASTHAPQLARMLRLRRSAMPRGSYDSGIMLVDKARQVACVMGVATAGE